MLFPWWKLPSYVRESPENLAEAAMTGKKGPIIQLENIIWKNARVGTSLQVPRE